MPTAPWIRRPVLGLATALTLALAHGMAVPRAEAAVTHNRLATNRLATNRLATNRLATNRLATNSLSSTRLETSLATAEILATPDGREVFAYLMSCALPEGMTIEADVPGAQNSEPPATPYTCANEHCVFPGALGLAEDWIDHPLDPTGQGWVSACIFARVNALDTAEAISLRGAHAGLEVSIDEAELFTLEEGAFFGNLFARDDSPIDWNVCLGADQASGETGGLALRDCAEPDPADPTKTFCGFNFAGACRDFNPDFPSEYACSRYDAAAGFYTRCHASSGLGHWPASPPYRQVITVFVSP